MGTITHSAVSDRWDTPLERRLYPVSAAAVSQATFHLLQRFCPSCLDTAGAPEIPEAAALCDSDCGLGAECVAPGFESHCIFQSPG